MHGVTIKITVNLHFTCLINYAVLLFPYLLIHTKDTEIARAVKVTALVLLR